MQKRIVGAVVLSRSPRNIFHALYGKRYVLMFAAAVVFVVVLLLTLFTSFAINKPMKQLIIQSQRAVRGEKGAVQALQRPVTKEVEQLSNAIAKMATTLEHRADYFQNFAAHVSHAFKTPLTAIQGAVEILQDHFDDMPVEKKHKFLSNIADDSRRLDALVRRLFDLAKADTVQVGSQSTPVLQRLDKLRLSHEFESLRITLPDKDDIRVKMESELFDSIVNTLLENAKLQSASEVKIDIDMQNNKQLSICFQDNGTGVSAANAERIFEPFFTTRANTGGTGLGLAVAKRLAIAHGGDLALRQHCGESAAVFCLTLPIASVA